MVATEYMYLPEMQPATIHVFISPSIGMTHLLAILSVQIIQPEPNFSFNEMILILIRLDVIYLNITGIHNLVVSNIFLYSFMLSTFFLIV